MPRQTYEHKYRVGDLVTVTAQRVAAERDHQSVVVGQVVAVRADTRSPTCTIITYMLELATAESPVQSAQFDESALEFYETERDDDV